MHKSTSNLNQLKQLLKLNEEKSNQFYSEPVSLEGTPKGFKPGKLEPLNQVLLARKLNAPRTPVRRHTKTQSEILTPKSVTTPSKASNIPNSTFDKPSTPKGSARLSSQKTKYSQSLITPPLTPVKQSKQSLQNPIVQLFQIPRTPKKTNREQTANSQIAPQQQNEERPPSSRKSMKRNLSVPSYRAIKVQTIEKGVLVNQLKVEELPAPNNEVSTAAPAATSKDICAGLPYRHLIFGPTIEVNTFKKHMILVQKGLSYAVKNLKSPSEKFIRSKQVSLNEPATKKSKTLLLDLDETLIHSCTLKCKPDVVLTYVGPPGEPSRQLPIKIRPYLKEFLVRMSALYEIVIFTASAINYAKTIINYLDKDRKYITTILSRENCMETRNGFFIKDLRIIKDRELSDMIIVDNLSYSFGFQLENGVPILEFTEDKKDEELKYLADYLTEAYNYTDLREFNAQKLGLRDIAEQDVEKAINDCIRL